MKKQTDTPDQINAFNARAAVRRVLKTRRQKEVAEGLGWKPSYLSQFLRMQGLATEKTVNRVKEYLGKL